MAFVEKIRRYAASDLYANEHKEDEDKAVHKESLWDCTSDDRDAYL